MINVTLSSCSFAAALISDAARWPDRAADEIRAVDRSQFTARVVGRDWRSYCEAYERGLQRSTASRLAV